MLPNAAIAAFAASPARQRAAHERGQAVGHSWHGRSDVRALTATLEGFVANPPDDAAAFGAALVPFLHDRSWLDAAVASATTAMRDDPFTALPWRLLQGALLSGLALIVRDTGHVAVQWTEPAAVVAHDMAPVTLSFGYSLILVLRASALSATHYVLDEDANAPTLGVAGTQSLAAGDILVADNSRESYRLSGLNSDVLLLCISFGVADAARPIRAFDAHNGALIRTGTSDSGASRMLPLLQLPRLSGRARGGDVLATVTAHPDRMLRWAAMREWLALDAHSALPRLEEMAHEDSDPGVRHTATRTLALINDQRPIDSSRSTAMDVAA